MARPQVPQALIDAIMDHDDGIVMHDGKPLSKKHQPTHRPGSLIRQINVWSGKTNNQRLEILNTIELVHCDMYAWQREVDAAGDGHLRILTVDRQREVDALGQSKHPMWTEDQS